MISFLVDQCLLNIAILYLIIFGVIFISTSLHVPKTFMQYCPQPKVHLTFPLIIISVGWPGVHRWALFKASLIKWLVVYQVRPNTNLISSKRHNVIIPICLQLDQLHTGKEQPVLQCYRQRGVFLSKHEPHVGM